MLPDRSIDYDRFSRSVIAVAIGGAWPRTGRKTRREEGEKKTLVNLPARDVICRI